MSLISDALLSYLPAKRKTTLSGWISFNAVCCDDDRGRGGLIFNAGDAVSYHCFNCQFKCSWQPGRPVSHKMRKFMRDLHMPDDLINKLALEALKLTENANAEQRSLIPTFDSRAMPMDSDLIENFLDDIPEKLVPVLKYLQDRHLYLEDYPFYWCPNIGFNNRIIIPFIYKGIIVGYTARAVGEAKPKYISEQQPGYVFNLDRQRNEREFVIVCEGPFDAISIDGCALLGAEIKEGQNWLLRQLNKEIVLVPDRDEAGLQTVEQALELGWSISMPDWPPGVKDVNDAVIKLGRLATLWLIASAKESNSLKIQLRAKKWFKEQHAEIT